MRLVPSCRLIGRRLRAFSRRSAAVAILLVVVIQVLPFTLEAPHPPGGGAKGFTQYIKALQVCGDDSGFGGFLADHSWLPAPAARVSDLGLEAGAPPDPPFVLPERPPRRLLRPPRA